MNDTYEELPCPDTNTFQVGDLVRVYRYGITEVLVSDKTVIELRGDAIIFKGLLAHFKQCRPLKLKEKPKPREFWIREWRYADIFNFECYRMKPQNDGEIFKVQDFCDSCGKDFNK